MKILAIEFSSARRSVAVMAAGLVCSRAGQTGERTAGALGLIAQALGDAGVRREEIECLAVGLGPGSYAGIRAAISLAQGWQVARPVRVAGISTIEALATQAQAARIFGRIHILLDAERQEFYSAAYEIDARHCRLVQPLHLATSEQVQAAARQGELLVSPDLLDRFPRARTLWPEATALGRLALECRDFTTGDKLEPIYLRAPNFVKAPPPRVMPAR